MYDYDYGYGYTDYDAVGGLLGGFLGGFIVVFLIIGLIALAVSIINIIALWKVYKKAGKGGWESIIPFYNTWVLVEIAGLNWWWFLLFFAPLVLGFIPILNVFSGLATLFVFFNCYYNIAKKFNKGTGFAVCLTLFSPICIPILGFSKNNVYNSNVAVSNNGVFGPSGNGNSNNNVNNMNYNNVNNNYTNSYQNNVQPQPMYNNETNTIPVVTPTQNIVQSDYMNNNVNTNTVSADVPTQNTMQNDSVNNNIDNSTPVDVPAQNHTENNNMGSATVQEFSFCGNCGTKLEGNVKFCPNCGQPK